MAPRPSMTPDPEIVAIGLVHSALKDLEPDSQQRVIDYVIRKFQLASNFTHENPREVPEDVSEAIEAQPRKPSAPQRSPDGAPEDDTDGISPVAKRWIRRNGIDVKGLSSIFSLGVDEIDLVAKKVPGGNKKDKMLSVFLLKGVAAYLSGGVARIVHDAVKEACVHYDAFDTNNFAAYLKNFSAEISGTKEAGYALTARGLTSATELVKKMIAGGSPAKAD